jgi:Ca2+-binding EF-hand superfamily protein
LQKRIPLFSVLFFFCIVACARASPFSLPFFLLFFFELPPPARQVEGMDVQRVDAAERELRDKLRASAFGPPLAGFHMRAVFRFFDRDARGAVDLGSFRAALQRLGLTYPFEPHLVAALFARYDTAMRGYVDLYQIVDEVLGEDYVSGTAKAQMAGQLQGALSTLRGTGRRDFARVLGAVDAQGSPGVDVHQLTDGDFLHRQRVRRVFRTLDRDNSGAIERPELDHLLVMLGLRVAPYELRAIFDYVDCDNSGAISFEEFYNW